MVLPRSPPRPGEQPVRLSRRVRVSDRRRMHACEIPPPPVFIVILLMVCAAMARADEAMIRLKATYPGIKVHEIDGRPAYIYGRPMSAGETSEEAVQNFLAEHGGSPQPTRCCTSTARGSTDWVHLTIGGDECDAAHPGTAIEVQSLFSGDPDELAIVCYAFGQFDIPDPTGDCP
jgi:hypothetical protein